MSSLYDQSPDCETPTFDEQAGNIPAFIFGQNDRAEMDAWFDSKETPMSDSELDAIFETEMMHRDAQAELGRIAAEITYKPVLPIITVRSRTRKGWFDLLDKAGKQVGHVRGRRKAHAQERAMEGRG